MTELFRWISNIFWKEETVENEDTSKTEEILEDYLKTDISEESLTGVVTNIKPGFVEIDSRYVGKCASDLNVGDSVSFVLHKTRNNEFISNVEPETINTDTTISYINIIGFIEKRDGSLIFVNDESYSLEGVESDFVPCIGDKVNLTICETIENNKKQYVLVEINPYNKLFSVGQITKWNDFEGIINDDIYFNRNYCNITTPINVGETILACIIESKKDGFKYRALSVQMSKKYFNIKSIFIEEISDLLIIEGQEKYFNINVFNLSKKWQSIISFLIEPRDVITLVNPKDLRSLPPETCISYKFCSQPNLSQNKFRIKLSWTFSRFSICRSFTARVISKKNDIWDLDKEKQNQVVLCAPRWNRKPNFRVIVLDPYNIPDNIKNLSTEMGNDRSVKIEFQKLMPDILNELTPHKYKRRFHQLLYLEEATLTNEYRKLDMVTSLNQRGDDIVLRLDSDNPHYEMLTYGDKIFAAALWDESILFEADLKDISSNEIMARFHPKFLTDFSDGRMYKIKFKPSRLHFRRMHHAIDVCSNVLSRRLFPKCIISDFSSSKLFEASNGSWINPKLNEEQKNSIINIIEQKKGEIPYIIFGPPGSGKTVTLVELILQIVKLQPFAKILVAAPSNSAVDAIAVNLLNSGVLMKQQILRLGSLRYFLRGDVVLSLKDVSFFLTDSSKDSLTYDVPLIDYDSIGKRNVTLGTFSIIGLLTNIKFRKDHFSYIIIDEAGQVTEPENLLPLRVLSENGGNIILCGDPLQLGPVIFSWAAGTLGLQKSLLARLTDMYPYAKDVERFPHSLGYNPAILTKLVFNYRAIPELVNMTSCLFYNNELKSALSNENSPERMLLEQIKSSFKWDILGSLLFHHVSGEEEQPSGSTSWVNTPEAIKVTMFLVKLYSAGVSPDQVGIITPYKKQSMFISKYAQQLNIILPKLGSVEEFQGHEKEIIILSLVRSGDLNPNSFINEPRRINVATSRAKALLLIIGNKQVLERNEIWKKMLNLSQEIYF